MSQFSSKILSEHAAVFNGKTPSNADKRASGQPVLKIKDVAEDGRFRGLFDSFVDSSFVEKYATKRVQRGDILILNAAHNADYVGSKVYRSEQEVWGALATGEWLIIRPKPPALDPDYTYYWVVNERTRHAIRQLVKGIHLYPNDVARLRIPLPPLPEQRRIAAILDKADEVRRKRQEAVRLTDDLLRSAFLDMFGDPVTKSWPILSIAEVVHPGRGSIRTGPFGSQLLHSEFVDEGVAVLGIDNVVANEFRWGERRFISENKYNQLKRYTVRPGDVLITIMGTCGRCAVVPDDIPVAINTKHLCCITLNQEICLPSYLHAYFLEHPIARQYLNKAAKGAIMAGLNMGLIKEMPIPIPPMNQQMHFAKISRNIQTIKGSLKNAAKESEVLFDSLVQRAFKGEL